MKVNPYYLKKTEDRYYDKSPEFLAWEEGRRAGIKEVVEWIEENLLIVVKEGVGMGEVNLLVGRAHESRKWQSKLKEWI